MPWKEFGVDVMRMFVTHVLGLNTLRRLPHSRPNLLNSGFFLSVVGFATGVVEGPLNPS